MDDKARVLILGGSPFQRDFIEEALAYRMPGGEGLECHVLDGNPGCVCAGMPGIRFSAVNFGDYEALQSYYLKQGPFIGVFAPAGETGNRMAARLAEEMGGMPYNPVRVVEATTDKGVLRQVAGEGGVRQPRMIFYRDAATVAAEIGYPCVVKPPACASAKGVTLVRGPEALAGAIAEALPFVDGDAGRILIEEYIAGDQYSLETVSVGGEHRLVALVQEHILRRGGHCLERCDQIALARDKELWSKAESFVQKLLEALGVIVGGCHIETRLRDGEFVLIEAGSRTGGFRHSLIKTARGQNFNQLVLCAYLAPNCAKKWFKNDLRPNRDALCNIVYFPEDQTHYQRAAEAGLEAEYIAYRPEYIYPPKSLADLHGFYYLADPKGGSLEEYILPLGEGVND